MSSLNLEIDDTPGNPLDIVERIAIANDWSYDRQADDELAAELPGQWCHYRLWFSWQADMGILHLACALDIKVAPAKRLGFYHLLGLANEKLWLGHFDLWSEENVPVFRHAILVRDAAAVGVETLEDLTELALGECERFFPAFQFHLRGGKAPVEALAAAMLETEGEA
ncbi:MAG: YbjN domain-containing protein [Pseudomonadota bacterium]